MATTIRNFAFQLNSASAGNLITLYEPGRTPGNVDSGRNCGMLLNLMMSVAIHGLPINTATNPNGTYVNPWSGKSIEILLRHASSASDVRLRRIDLPVSSIEYVNDLYSILFGAREFALSPDSRLAARMIDAGHGFLASNQFLRIYGSASEDNERNIA